jgi:predicted neutral ceramidase superfamily lipid hydrolase
VKKSIDFAFDDHPPSDEDKARVAWAVAVLDDCDGCADIRVELSVEDAGAKGTGVVGHLAPATVRRLRAALAAALREVGEEPGA